MKQRRVVITQQSNPFRMIVEFEELSNHRFNPVETVVLERITDKDSLLVNYWMVHSSLFEDFWFDNHYDAHRLK